MMLTIATAELNNLKLEIHTFSTNSGIDATPEEMKWTFEKCNCKDLGGPGDFSCGSNLVPNMMIRDDMWNTKLRGWLNRLKNPPRRTGSASNAQNYPALPQSGYPQQGYQAVIPQSGYLQQGYPSVNPLYGYVQQGYVPATSRKSEFNIAAQGVISSERILYLKKIPTRVSIKGMGHLRGVLERLGLKVRKVEMITGDSVATVIFATNQDALATTDGTDPQIALRGYKFDDPPNQPGLNKTETGLEASWHEAPTRPLPSQVYVTNLSRYSPSNLIATFGRRSCAGGKHTLLTSCVL
jgi:hypothetical protein